MTTPAKAGKSATAGRSKSRLDFDGDLFRAMRQHDIDAILAASTLRKFAASDVMVHAGQPATHLFLIRTGRVNYFRLTPDGREVVLGLLGPGNTFGLGTLLSEPTEYLGTAQAIKPGEAFVWSHALLLKLSAAYPKLAQNALRIVLGYLALYADRHIGLLSKTSENRLADTLIRLGCTFGRMSPEGCHVDIKNEHLASVADVNFFTASRLLKSWERSGAVKKGRGTVTILRPEQLRIE